VLEGLFLIALSDGHYHPNEDTYLEEVARQFGLGESCFNSLKARFVDGEVHDPYDVLGVPHDAAIEDIRRAWRQAVKDSHPDAMLARGVPPEALRLAERRLIDINRAWDEIRSKVAA
ncbi:MAG: TerB family tellurite resistance protein, partial [Paracoccaceae bacterium]